MERQTIEQATSYHPRKNIEAKAQRSNVRWVTEIYDDEGLLLGLRLAHPHLPWKRIQRMFNDRVPARRKRTLGAVIARGSAVRKARASPDGPLSHTTPSNYTITESRTTGGDTAILPPSPPMTHMETLSHSWYGDIDVDGYSTLTAMERQASEAAKMEATAAASGTCCCTNPFL